MKASIQMEKLNLPDQFSEYLTYCRNLKFEEEPNYDYLLGLMQQIASDFDFSLTDNVYDWSVL